MGVYQCLIMQKYTVLVNLMLGIVGGFWRIFGLVEMSTQRLLMVPSEG